MHAIAILAVLAGFGLLFLSSPETGAPAELSERCDACRALCSDGSQPQTQSFLGLRRQSTE